MASIRAISIGDILRQESDVISDALRSTYLHVAVDLREDEALISDKTVSLLSGYTRPVAVPTLLDRAMLEIAE